MKRSVAVLSALVLAGCICVPGALQTAWSQIPQIPQIPGVPGGAGLPSVPGMGNMQNLAQMLHLSPAQISKLQPLLQNEMGKLAGIRNNPKLSGQQKVSQAQVVRSQTDPQVKSILDPSQFRQWQSLRQNGLGELKNSFLH